MQKSSVEVFYPPKRGFKLIIHVPSSIVNVEKGLLKKSFITGLVGRACGIFRVDMIDIYVDPDSSLREAWFIKKILDYMSTPSYLRRKLMPLDKDLRGVGVLPPLATPNQVSREMRSIRHFREGVVVEVKNDLVCIEAGLDKKKCVEYSREELGFLRVGDRVIAEVIDGEILRIIPRERFLEKHYWVFETSISSSLRESLDKYRSSVIVSSRKGVYLDNSVARRIVELTDLGDLSIVFGSPDKDPDEIAELEGWDLSSKSNLVINTAPLQGVRSIRTFEALYITLSLINNIIYLSKRL